MMREHRRVAAVPVGVVGRAAEDLHPPGRHVRAVIFTHPAREELPDQVVSLDPVVEGVDQVPKCRRTAGPLQQRRVFGHEPTVGLEGGSESGGPRRPRVSTRENASMTISAPPSDERRPAAQRHRQLRRAAARRAPVEVSAERGRPHAGSVDGARPSVVGTGRPSTAHALSTDRSC